MVVREGCVRACMSESVGVCVCMRVRARVSACVCVHARTREWRARIKGVGGCEVVC